MFSQTHLVTLAVGTQDKNLFGYHFAWYVIHMYIFNVHRPLCTQLSNNDLLYFMRSFCCMYVWDKKRRTVD
jgi:hypothetical protein